MEPKELLFNQDETAAIQLDSMPDTFQPFGATASPLAIAKRVCVCKQTVLKHTLQSLSLKMHEAVACMVGNNQMLGSVSIDVPPHGQYPLLHRRKFYGDYELTEKDALESASLATLIYLQKSGIIVVDDINLGRVANCEAELEACQRKLWAASTWATMFQERTESLQAKLAVVTKANEQLIQTVKTFGVKGEATGQETSGVKVEMSSLQASSVKKEQFAETVCPVQPDTSLTPRKKQRMLPNANVRRLLFQTASADHLQPQLRNIGGESDKT